MEQFVKNNPNINLSEVGIKFGISDPQVGNILKKLGYTYKKTCTYVESCKEKKRQYAKTIEDITSEKLVYIDESWIEMGARKDRGSG